QKFFGHAATDHAGAADAILLRDHHACAVARSDARRAHAAGARAHDEQVDVVLRHAAFPARPTRPGERAFYRSWPFFLISARKGLMPSSTNFFCQACAMSTLSSMIFGSSSMNFFPAALL